MGDPLSAEVPAVRARRAPHAGRRPRRRAEQVLVDVRAVQRAAAARSPAGSLADQGHRASPG